MSEECCSENEAIAAGLAVIEHYKADGDSDFDKGMRALQKAFGVKRKSRKRSA